jgi:hypothetical protein
MNNNLPYDWDYFYRRCSNCGCRYHASEGGCDCLEDEEEGIPYEFSEQKKIDEKKNKLLGLA